MRTTVSTTVKTTIHATGLATDNDVTVDAGAVRLEGVFGPAPEAVGTVIFAHGSGSGRKSPRNQYVARQLQRSGMSTLLLDLLTPAEDQVYRTRFDIALLEPRLAAACAWVRARQGDAALPIGLFGASTGAAVALRVAAGHPGEIAAVVSRGGRPDLAGVAALETLRSPTLLIVGGNDDQVIGLNEAARELILCDARLEIVAGATHLFEESGALEQVAALAAAWFRSHFGAPPA
ncbi:MAG: dienelactone hydrolase family protein [Pseudomonadota bacterium]|nr:dienelactone hydrolase family protein [Pseudomonadota bacterium]